MCVVLVVVCGLANNHSKQQTYTTAVDETKDDNEAKAPATSSAERYHYCLFSASFKTKEAENRYKKYKKIS